MIQMVALQIDFPHAIKYSYGFVSSSLRNHSHFINFGQYANAQQNVNKVKYIWTKLITAQSRKRAF